MNKEQFAKYISENFECSRLAAKAMIDIFSCSVYMAMSEGHKVDIDSLGIFSASYIPEREMLTDKNGSEVLAIIPERLQPVFKPGEDLKMACAF